MSALSFRRYHRYPIVMSAVVTIGDQASPGNLTTQVNNISQGGMGMYSNIPLEMTTPVSVVLSYPAQEGDREILRGRVASLSQQIDRYFMGIAFDAPLTHEHLMKILRWE